MDPAEYTNPGDFIIDAVGLDPARDETNDNSCGTSPRGRNSGLGSTDLVEAYKASGIPESVLRSVRATLDLDAAPYQEEVGSWFL